MDRNAAHARRRLELATDELMTAITSAVEAIRADGQDRRALLAQAQRAVDVAEWQVSEANDTVWDSRSLAGQTAGNAADAMTDVIADAQDLIATVRRNAHLM